MIATGTRIHWEPREEWGESPVSTGRVSFGVRGGDGITYLIRDINTTVHESRITKIEL